METEPQTSFEQLPMARAEFPSMLVGMYRVYQDAKNYTTVQAVSALEALEQSGLQSAIKIEREQLHSINLLRPNFVGQANTEMPPVAQPMPEAAPAVVMENSGADTLAGAPLSNNDIDQLLKS